MLDITHDLIEAVSQIAITAGTAILRHYNSPLDVHHKSDGSPLLQADLDAHTLITEALPQLRPNIPVVSEESEHLEYIPEGHAFWLVDPLDGTKEFIKKNDEFTVNIALIDAGKPILGVIYAPALKCLYQGSMHGAFKKNGENFQKLHVAPPEKSGLRVTASRSHGNDNALSVFFKNYTILETLPAGSSLKFCKIAEGDADVYPRLGRTMAWDTAAGQAIVTAAGGHVSTLSGNPLTYRSNALENPHFVASSTLLSGLFQ